MLNGKQDDSLSANVRKSLQADRAIGEKAEKLELGAWIVLRFGEINVRSWRLDWKW